MQTFQGHARVVVRQGTTSGCITGKSFPFTSIRDRNRTEPALDHSAVKPIKNNKYKFPSPTGNFQEYCDLYKMELLPTG